MKTAGVRQIGGTQPTTIAIDAGGTFTDCVIRRGDQYFEHHKVPSTPNAPEQAVLEIIQRFVPNESIHCRHGTTVGTNQLLERQAGEILLITNEGFEDILLLGRQARPNVYALEPQKAAPLIARHSILGCATRRDAEGQAQIPVPCWNDFVRAHAQRLEKAEAVAIAFLHSSLYPQDEQELARAIRKYFPSLRLSLSSEISSIQREYERTSTAVANAYLQPIVGTYLERLSQALKTSSQLTVMTSMGGLVDADRIQEQPIHTVLSGPAGGYLGAARAGARCGEDSLLCLDMGGTSTDVSVIAPNLSPDSDNAFEDLPLGIPMLPITTIGAGGGSIAYVDEGGILRVGPNSAGATPGPACYGQQRHSQVWQPTVTDAHVVLNHLQCLLGGKFELKKEDAFAAISMLAGDLGESTEATARAILKTCTAKMARACRRVSLEQGLDPRTLTIVAFGGAGGLHACELADELGCERVIFPARAGVLSADGISQAPITSMREQACHLPEHEWNRQSLTHLWTTHARETDSVALQMWVGCRLKFQERVLMIPFSQSANPLMLRTHFVEAFKQRYGYEPAPDQALELVSIREVVTIEPAINFASPSNSVGATQHGPITLSFYDSTLRIPHGWSVQALPSDDFLCLRGTPKTLESTALSIPLELDIYHQKLMSIAEEMGRVLQDTAISTNIRERRDFSCALFDSTGQMLAHAAHIPVHLGASPLSVQAVIQRCALKRDCDYIVNDPFAGGTHLPDITVVRPIFSMHSDVPIFFVANRAHHADVGGITPGSLPIATRNQFSDGLSIHDEGVRIEPMLLDEAVFTVVMNGSRLPLERRADLNAQVAANDAATGRLVDLIAKTKTEELQTFNRALLAYTERRTARWIDGIPTGEYLGEDALESDGLSDYPLPLSVRIQRKKNVLTFDFTKCSGPSLSSLNAVSSITRSAVFYVIKLLVGDVPANDGLMKRIQIITRPGTLVDAQDPAAVSAGNVETSQRIVDVLLNAFAEIFPEKIPAQSCGSMNNVLLGGIDDRNGKRHTFVHYETLGGGAGAGPNGRGCDGIHVHMTNTLNTPIEVFERRFPIRIPRYALRPHDDNVLGIPGGRGIQRHYAFLSDTTVTLIAERHRVAPKGRFGGSNGTNGEAYRVGLDGKQEQLASKFTYLFRAGEQLIIKTAGGGAWGIEKR